MTKPKHDQQISGVLVTKDFETGIMTPQDLTGFDLITRFPKIFILFLFLVHFLSYFLFPISFPFPFFFSISFQCAKSRLTYAIYFDLQHHHSAPCCTIPSFLTFVTAISPPTNVPICCSHKNFNTRWNQAGTSSF